MRDVLWDTMTLAARLLMSVDLHVLHFASEPVVESSEDAVWRNVGPPPTPVCGYLWQLFAMIRKRKKKKKRFLY